MSDKYYVIRYSFHGEMCEIVKAMSPSEACVKFIQKIEKETGERPNILDIHNIN
jgi:hypothetical protein